jgi:phosphomannomutase
VAHYADDAEVDRLDGASLDFGDWRANIRASNTEPLLRLNVEARGDAGLLQDKVNEIGAMVAELEQDGN